MLLPGRTQVAQRLGNLLQQRQQLDLDAAYHSIAPRRRQHERRLDRNPSHNTACGRFWKLEKRTISRNIFPRPQTGGSLDERHLLLIYFIQASPFLKSIRSFRHHCHPLDLDHARVHVVLVLMLLIHVIMNMSATSSQLSTLG